MKLLNKIVGVFGFKLVEKGLIKKQRLISQDTYLKIDTVLKKIFKKFEIRNVIHVGANDGIRFDELLKFLSSEKCNCILIEPMPIYFDELKKNFEHLKNLKFENSAISKNNELSFLYAVKQKYIEDYDEHIKGINSFDINHLIKHGVKKKHIEKLKVKTTNFEKLFKKYNINDLDLLYVDTEGYDGEILINFFETSKSKPIIIFEYIHIENETFKKVLNILKKNEYSFFSLNENMICFEKKKNFL